MPTLSVMEIIIIIVIGIIILGSIIGLILLLRRHHTSNDEVMLELRRRRGGELTTMTSGRQVLQIPLPGGILRVGFWDKSTVYEKTFVSGFYVRWKPNRGHPVMQFVLRYVDSSQNLPELEGFDLVEQRLWYADQEFRLFLPLVTSVQDQEELLLKFTEHMPKLAGLMDVAEVSWLGGTLSIRFRTPVDDARRAGLLIGDATMFLTNFLKQVE